ncbi:hypothetical protein TI39_contig4387g00001 [Zymoseptoria brevis]|uniref:Uncharacterized protein n=1 Tax=Zymoseptoria brevis TaxID=1047168 RepID=A0A0F4G6Z6_9PEZI|nr:hypothetical protein TI39_contig4387g00001 [Zymoseptoria brevis]
MAKLSPIALRITSPSGAVESSPLEVVESEPLPFFDLSFDLRQAVLMQVFPSSTLGVFLRGNVHNFSVGVLFPPIVRATKRLRAEGLYAALKQTDLEIRSGPGNAAFTAWLATIDFSLLHGDINTNIATGFDAVHKLSFPFFSRFPYWHLPRTALNEDVELMKKCTQLQQVTLKLQAGDLIDNMEEDLLKTPIQLVGTFRMDGVLTLKRLEKLILVGKVMKWYADWEVDGITGLKKWLDEEYKKLGHKVVVTIIDE